MRAVERLLSLLKRVSSRGEDRWIAKCPAHQDRTPSQSLAVIPAGVVLHCHAGCTVADICTALGIGLRDLYNDSRHRPPDRLSQRKRRVVELLDEWHQAEMLRCAEDLRLRDMIVRQIDHAVEDGVLTEDEVMLSLSHEYEGYGELEYRFERLLRADGIFALWGESRCG